MTPRISGVIAGTGADTALIDQITPASPRVSSLGSVVADVLAAKPTLLCVVIAIHLGIVYCGPDAATLTVTGVIPNKVTITPTGTVRALADWRANLAVVSGTTGFAAGTLTPSTAGTSEIGAVLKDVLDPSELSFSLSSFVDAVDRAYQTADGANDLAIVIDQAAQTVKVVGGGTGSDMVIAGATETFTRTVVSASGAQWGE